MTDAATDPDDIETGGFPAVPDFDIAEDGKEPSRAVDRCLGALDRKPVQGFGAAAMAMTAQAVSEMRVTLHPLGLVDEATALGQFDAALAGFSTSEDDGRRRRTTMEWIKRLDAPLGEFLGRLEALVRAVPDVSGRRPAGWDKLASIYRQAHESLSDLADHVRAGQIRFGELTARIEATRETSKDSDLGNDLRKKRDAIERRTHLLRIVRGRTADFLTEVRNAAEARTALDTELQTLASRALPAWETVLLAVAEDAQDRADGRRAIDLSPVIEANATLRSDIRGALDAATALREACGVAEGQDPGAIEEIEKRIMGSGETPERGS